MYAQAESVMERLSPMRPQAMSREQLVAEVEVLRARASQLTVRVEHLEEAREHYRRMNQHHRTEMERALARATREGMYRRLLAQEWAAAGRKVRMLSRSIEAIKLAHDLAITLERGRTQGAMEIGQAAQASLAELRSKSSVVGL
jgi:hypothetical protein